MSVNEVIERVVAARQALDALHPRVAGAGPWPLSDSYGIDPEAWWGPRETLAHLAESLQFWTGELERVVEQGGGPEPVPFGRVADDQLRLDLIGRDRSVPLRELHARVASTADRIAGRLAELSPGELDRRGTHPRYGAMGVEAIARRFMADHLEDHVRQLERILAEGTGKQARSDA